MLFDFDFASVITSGKGVIFLSFSNKWLSRDGLDFVAVMSVDDALDTVEGRFSFAGETVPRDADGDGVADDEDNCPNEPNEGQDDGDDDGAGDDCDACPRDPERTVPGHEGCAGLQQSGDCNQDGDLDLSDAVCLFRFLVRAEAGTLTAVDVWFNESVQGPTVEDTARADRDRLRRW